MLYAIISEDVENSLTLRMSVRPAHLARLQDLQDAGKLVLAGPFPAIDSAHPGDAGFTGSLIVAEFSELSAAEHWANTDPYFLAGVFARVTVKPFKQIFPQ
ncbi:MAG: YciI family protein [Methylovulum sp.]|jgi:uncharacterized protein YciI|nr:YciI family protein [Methylovulum sp.]